MPVNDELFATLQAICRGATAREVLKRLDAQITVNAVNNRLECLRACGLVARIRVRKSWVYSTIAFPKKRARAKKGR